MAIPQGFQRAKLEIEGEEPIEVLFNPKEYTVAKTNTWNFAPAPGTSIPPAQFGGGNPRELTLNLLLDVSLLGPERSVREVTDRLFKMMEVPGTSTGAKTNAVPPFVTFRWGSVVTFKAVCASLTVAFQLFHPNGEPIRADVDLSLKQAEKASSASSTSAGKPGNPTTRAVPGLGVRTVKAGDSLPSLAHEAYGDATRWRLIAEANGVDDPLRLRRGSALAIPRLEG